MIASRHITRIVAAVMAIAVCLCFCAAAFSESITAAAGDSGVTMEYETALFDTGEVLSVNILMDEADWADMLENAISEEYYSCTVEIGRKRSASARRAIPASATSPTIPRPTATASSWNSITMWRARPASDWTSSS